MILEELRKVRSHPTATALYGLVRRRLPRISLGTVYRNLELLAEMGVIRKLDFGGSEARFDSETHRHEHVRCIECGRIDDVNGATVEDPNFDSTAFGGYEVRDYRMEFLGICPECLRNGKNEEHSLEQDTP